MSHKRLWIPGPTEVQAEALQAQVKPMVGHRSGEYTELYESVIGKLAEYFQTRQNVCTVTASGTIWMDITGRCMVKKKALAAVCGAFSKRMYQTIVDCGKDTTLLDVEWGKAVKPEMVMEELAKDDFDTLIIVHNETSTGVRNPIAEIGKALKVEYPDMMFVVDAVSSAGGDYLVPEELYTDILFTSTQKCFALPPGLSIACYSDAALARAEEVPGRGFYTDLLAVHKNWEKRHQNPTTPAIALLNALEFQLVRMLEETPKGRFARHQAMAEHTRDWADRHFEMFPEKGYESVTVSTITNTQEKDVGELNKALAAKNWQIANGYGALKGNTFRIGHMGDWTLEDVKALLDDIDEIWGL
jgi:predicted phosphoserine aminotransferase